MSEVYKKLMKVQSELKVPKNQYNDFGGYSFRSCEDILEKAKPVLKKYELVMKISDEIVVKGDRYYIKATVLILDVESGDSTTVTGWARESENQKGMDKSQISGKASSYARKYALDGMFALDESKDADAINKHGKGKSNKRSSKNKSNNNSSKKKSSNKSKFSNVTCDHEACNEELSEKVINYCKSQSDKFDNKLLCFEHQKSYGSGTKKR